MSPSLFSSEEISGTEVVASRPRCAKCGLYKHCKSPKMEGSGRANKPILFVAEAPGKAEDARGIQLVGHAGQLLRETLHEIGIDLDMCRKINAINCRPEKNRTPTSLEIDHCRPMVWNEIRSSAPNVIVTLGASALESLIGRDWKAALGGIGRWRGYQIPHRELGAWICPTYHPSFLLRQDEKDGSHVLFRTDLTNAVSKMREPVPIPEQKEAASVGLIWDEQDAIDVITEVTEHNEIVAFDYETTGLKPQAEGHDIISCAISSEDFGTWAFPMTRKLYPAWIKFLISETRKVAANLKFEEKWSQHIFGVCVNEWVWDTMLAAHVLDNRRGVSPMDFQAYAILGVRDYSSHLKPYLKGKDDKNANSLNRIHDVDLEELLVYNGIDALLERQLAEIQMNTTGVNE